MASPLAVGDCIAIIGVLTKFYNALSGSSDDAKELNRLVVDLGYMKDVLSKMSRPSSPQTPDPAADSDTLNEAVNRCKIALSEFSIATKKYAPTDSRVTSKAIDELKADMQRHVVSLASQVGQGTEEIKTQIYAAIDEPFDHKPIQFQDARGRRFSVPLEICQSFEDFCDFLHFTFKKLHPLLLPYVTRRDFWLFTPSLNGSPWWYLLNEDDWVKVARSGLRLGMSLFKAKPLQGVSNVRKCGWYIDMGIPSSITPAEERPLNDIPDFTSSPGMYDKEASAMGDLIRSAHTNLAKVSAKVSMCAKISDYRQPEEEDLVERERFIRVPRDLEVPDWLRTFTFDSCS
ncbi:hypothetical protein SLS62_009845 [Diatrype stigma]|uniref:Ubiquitin-like domain-containing protein n=1 Tax=Diatrype stigma TaxID=117547 RepID=A0AAN9UE08_9PEZI